MFRIIGRRARALTRVPALLATLLIASCGGSGDARPVARTIPSGTARMADSLASINARAIPRADANPFLNRARIDLITKQIAALGGDPQGEARYRLAEEQLKAGRTQDAIDGLEKLVRDVGISWDSIAPRQKPFFDLLAIAYMRLGEQQNCLDNPAANICILPLDGGARHNKQDGARGAIWRYARILRQYPDDRGSQWLLNLAWLQLGHYPDSVPARYRIQNLAPARGTAGFPVYPNVAPNVGLSLTGIAGSLNVDDLNGDGHLDLFMTDWGIADAVHVFLADGQGGYVDRTPLAGLKGIVGGLNATHADYDNDGDVDIVVLRGAWMREEGNYPLSLLRNRGDGSFDDVTIDSGLWSVGPTNTASFADFNLDGHLDLFVGYESYKRLNGGPSHPSKLFMNNGDGTFTEVAAKVGITVDDFVKGVTWGDVNNDGLPDLYLSVIYGRNKLFMNRGGTTPATWRFEETAAVAGVEMPLASFATWFWDYDNDGWVDLLVPSYDVNSAMHEMVAREYLGLPLSVRVDDVDVTFENSKLYRNRGDGTFEDVTARAGLTGKVLFAMGSNFGDLDNDGWLDFYVGTGNPDLRSVIPNRMFRNAGGRAFEEVTIPGGFGHLQKGHAIAFADLDRDGDQDVYARIGGAYEGDLSSSVLFDNPGWSGTHWINLELVGASANRSAIGARVAVVMVDSAGATRTVHRTIGTGGSFGAGPLQLHVGLGRAASITEVRVQWPDKKKTRTSYLSPAMDQFYRITQGSAPVVQPRPRVAFRSVGAAASQAMQMRH